MRWRAGERVVITAVAVIAVLLPFGLIGWWLVTIERAPSEAEVGDLLRSLGGVYWPVVVLLVAVLFRHEVLHLARRLQEATFGRFGFKFSVSELEATVVVAGADQATLPPPEAQGPPPDGGEPAPIGPQPATPSMSGGAVAPAEPAARAIDQDWWSTVAKRLAARGNPEGRRFYEVADAINRAAYDLAAVLGVPVDERRSISQLLRALNKRGVLANRAVYAIHDFFEIRNEVLYGSRGRLPSEAGRALDVGLALLHLVASIPRPTYRVVGQVPIYQDERGQIPVDDATGVVIRTTSPDGLVTNEAVYPTRRSYQVGSRIAWDWDVTGKFSAAWYQNQNGEYIKAWDRSAEFVGEPLSERESERSTR